MCVCVFMSRSVNEIGVRKCVVGVKGVFMRDQILVCEKGRQLDSIESL